jgi:TPP-dependent pyruvate/acetoin dehydrogenase alpha subunit
LSNFFPQKAIDKDIRKQIDEEAKKAQDAPFPDAKELYTDVYSKSSGPYYARAVDLVDSVVVPNK